MSTSYCNAYDYERMHGCKPGEEPVADVVAKVVEAPAPAAPEKSAAEVTTK